MERSEFLKILSAGAGSLLFTGFDVKSENIKYDLKKVKIYDNYVRGVNFRKKDFLKTSLQENDLVNLVREGENKYDRFAIKVEKDGKFLGYIPAYENIVLAMLLDQGVQLEARVSNVKNIIDEDKYLDKVFAIEVFTKLLVPFQNLQTNNLANRRADDAVDIYRNKI